MSYSTFCLSMEDYESSSKGSESPPPPYPEGMDETSYHDYKVHFTSDGYPKDYVIYGSDTTNTPLYVALTVKSVSRNKPNVRLFSVQNTSLEPEVKMDGTKTKKSQAESGNVVAVAHFPAFTKTTQIGFGNPDMPDSVQWEAMKMPKIGVWEFSVDSSQHDKQYLNTFSNSIDDVKSPTEAETIYQWRRTHTKVDGVGKNPEARRKLVNNKGEIVALFIPHALRSLRRTGTLRIFKKQLGGTSDSATGIDKDMELRVIMTHCVIVERLRG